MVAARSEIADFGLVELGRRGQKLFVQCPHCGPKPRNKTRAVLFLDGGGRPTGFKCQGCTTTIRDLRGSGRNFSTPITVAPTTTTDAPIASATRRDAIYHGLLRRLELSAEDRADLHRRGIDDAAIARHGYRTLPIRGRSQIARELLREHGEEALRGVPGFFIKAAGLGNYWTIAGAAGLLIPVRDADGLIVGLQIRSHDIKDSRYRWFSSTGKPGGCGSGAPIHAAAPTKHGGERWITEGSIKANIAADRLGQIVLAVPGVANWRSALETIDALPHTGGIVVAFDADFRSKLSVLHSLHELIDALRDRGHAVRVATWDQAGGKGIDDLLVAGGAYRLVDAGELQRLYPRAGQPMQSWRSRFIRTGAAPAPRPATITHAEYRDQLADRRLEIFSGGPGVYLDRALAGTGKTYATGRTLALPVLAEQRSITFVENHEQAKSVLDAYTDASLVAARMPDRRNEDNCWRMDEVSAAEALGLEITKSVCLGCPHHPRNRQANQAEPCKYFAELATAKQARHLIACYARLPDAEILRDRDIVICDENPVMHLRPQQQIKLAQLIEVQQLIDRLLRSVQSDHVKDPGLIALVRQLSLLVAGLVESAQTAGDRIELIDTPHERDGQHVRGLAPDKRAVRALCLRIRGESHQARDFYDQAAAALGGGILQSLLTLLDATAERRHGLTVHRVGVTDSDGEIAGVLYFTRQIKLPADRVVLLQDATADALAVGAAVGRRIVDITPAARLPDQGRLRQLLNRGYSRRMLDKDLSPAIHTITHLLDEHATCSRVGLLTHKRHVQKLLDALPEHYRARITHTGHFGGDGRGVNRFLECELLIVLGTPRVPAAALAGQAIRVNGLEIDGQAIPAPRRVAERVATDAGGVIETAYVGYADPIFAAAMNEIVRAEITQASGRGRNLSAGAGPITYVCSTLPIADAGCYGAEAGLLAELHEGDGEIAGLIADAGEQGIGVRALERLAERPYSTICKAVGRLERFGLVAAVGRGHWRASDGPNCGLCVRFVQCDEFDPTSKNKSESTNRDQTLRIGPQRQNWDQLLVLSDYGLIRSGVGPWEGATGWAGRSVPVLAAAGVAARLGDTGDPGGDAGCFWGDQELRLW